MISSIEVVVAVAVRTPPLMASYYIWGLVLRCVSPADVIYTVRLLDSSQLRCGKQLLTPDTARRCESIVPLHHAMQRSACSRRAFNYISGLDI